MEKLKRLSEKQEIIALALIGLFFFFNSCSSSSAPPANQVFIQGMAFSPATLTITAGTTVKWTNKDAVTHTVTSDSGVFDSGNVTTGNTFSYQFMTAGTFSYHCTIHPYMVAKVVVN